MSSLNNKIKGGSIAFVGYILSPLSWWNDLFVNIPLAYVFAACVAFFSKNLFFPALIFGYWGTNVLGLVMMHYGALKVSGKSAMTKKDFAVHIAVSMVYTVIMVYLIQKGILKFPMEYFQK